MGVTAEQARRVLELLGVEATEIRVDLAVVMLRVLARACFRL